MNRCSFIRYEGEATRLTFAKATSALYCSLATEEEIGKCKGKNGLCSTRVRVAWSREMTAHIHTHRLPCSLLAWLPGLRSKLARGEQRRLDADGEVVLFPLVHYFVAMSVRTNQRALFMLEPHTPYQTEVDVTCYGPPFHLD